MKRKLSLILATVLLLTCMIGVMVSASADGQVTFPLEPLYAGESILLLDNPGRGLRHELNVYAGTGTAGANWTDMKAVWLYAGDANAFDAMEKDMAHYASDSPKLAQVYIYLTKYTQVDNLPQELFDSLDAYFEKLKSYGVKAVLRFVYQHTQGNGDDGTNYSDDEYQNIIRPNRNVTPNAARAISHFVQLAPWIEKWQDQIHVLQSGIIGAWGEWDSGEAGKFNTNAPATTYPLDRNGNSLTGLTGANRGQKALLMTQLENIPEDMLLQVRYEYNKYDNFKLPGELGYQAIDDTYYNRIGFMDDAMRGETLFSNNTGGNNQNSEAYRKVREESAYLLVDGELYWGSSNTGSKDGAGPGTDSGLFLALHMKERHFTSLSLVHNYKERGKNITGIATSMPEWQHEYVNKALLDTYAPKAGAPGGTGLNYDPDWLKNSKGQPVARTVFEYIRDYLGYYLKGLNGNARVTDHTVTVQFTLQNYGFSAPHGLPSITLVLLDANGVEVAAQDAFVSTLLQPMQPQTANVTLSAPEAGTYSVALSLRASTGEGARLANNIIFADGYNILGQVEIQ